MDITHEIKDQVAVLKFTGRLDAYHAPILKEAFENLAGTYSNYVFNFSDLEFIDSTGLGRVVACLKRVSELGGDIRLACLNDKVRMVFEITRAHKIFDIYEDESVAIESFNE